jgi:hypothetical protein
MRTTAHGVSLGVDAGRRRTPTFFIVSIVLPIDIHCSCAGGFSLAGARLWIEIGAHFAL